MTVDPLRLRALFGHMAEAVRQLGAEPEDAFLADFRNTASAKYLLVVATEAATDACNHVVARSGGRAPDDYADCFTILGELGVVAPDLVERLQQMARFRNLLVHLYGRVDDRQVYRIIHENLGDLDRFREQVLAGLPKP